MIINYLRQLYTRIKYESVIVYIKDTKRGGDYIIVSKRTLHFKCFQRKSKTS